MPASTSTSRRASALARHAKVIDIGPSRQTRRSSVKFAEVDEVATQAETWSDEVLNCRTYNHNWVPSQAAWEEGGSILHVVHSCERCTTQKHMEMSQSGHVYNQWYEYADGYLSKGLGRIAGDARDLLRITSVTRTFDLKMPKKPRAKPRAKKS